MHEPRENGVHSILTAPSSGLNSGVAAVAVAGGSLQRGQSAPAVDLPLDELDTQPRKGCPAPRRAAEVVRDLLPVAGHMANVRRSMTATPWNSTPTASALVRVYLAVRTRPCATHALLGSPGRAVSFHAGGLRAFGSASCAGIVTTKRDVKRLVLAHFRGGATRFQV